MDVKSSVVVGDWIVCGWFTDDAIYRPLAEKLAKSLDAVGAPYDFVCAPQTGAGWELNTMAKAEQVLAAMNRHPAKTIIFSDVDCIAHGDVSRLAEVAGDVAFRFKAKRRASGMVRLTVLSGYLVVKSTHGARRLVEKWAELSKDANWGDVDQTTLALAVGNSHGCAISHLDQTLIAEAFHHIAISNTTANKISGLKRELVNLWHWATRRQANHALRTTTRA